MDASMFAAPIPGAGPPTSPEEYRNRVDAWAKFLSDKGVQSEIQRMGLAQGLMTFGSRLMQNTASGAPPLAQIGNATEAGVQAYGDTKGQYLQNALNIAKAQSEEDDKWGRRAQEGRRLGETERHQKESERLQARGQDMQLQAARLYAARGAGGGSAADKYQALNALDDNASKAAGPQPVEKDFTDLEGNVNLAAFEAALFRWGQRFAIAKQTLAESGRYGNIWGNKEGKPAEMEAKVGKVGRPIGAPPANFETGSLMGNTPFEAPASGSMQVKGAAPAPPSAPPPVSPGTAMGMPMSKLEGAVDPITAYWLRLRAEWMAGNQVDTIPELYEQLLREHLISANPGGAAPPLQGQSYPGAINYPPGTAYPGSVKY